MPKTTAAILLSRQPLRPSGKTAWVRQSAAAVRWLKSQGLVLHSSVGMQTWELLTSLASIERIKQTLSVPAANGDEIERLKESAIDQFDLNPNLVDFVPVLSEEKNATKEELWLKRDKAVVEAADVLIPISLRKDGLMDVWLQLLGRQGKYIENQFRTGYQKRDQSLSYRLKAEQLNPKLRQLEDRYLIHWTRVSNSAWPTEKLIDYYKAIIVSDSYPRSAFSTLMNIISTKKIIATPKNMPAGIPTVSFSGLAAINVLPLIRWRARFSQMSFELYGIGIEMEYAKSRCVLPVRYYDKSSDHPAAGEPWLWQSIGEKSDWRLEQEYRHKGDFDLTGIPPSRLLIICHTQSEAAIIERSTGMRTVWSLRGEK